MIPVNDFEFNADVCDIAMYVSCQLSLMIAWLIPTICGCYRSRQGFIVLHAKCVTLTRRGRRFMWPIPHLYVRQLGAFDAPKRVRRKADVDILLYQPFLFYAGVASTADGRLGSSRPRVLTLVQPCTMKRREHNCSDHRFEAAVRSSMFDVVSLPLPQLAAV